MQHFLFLRDIFPCVGVGVSMCVGWEGVCENTSVWGCMGVLGGMCLCVQAKADKSVGKMSEKDPTALHIKGLLSRPVSANCSQNKKNRGIGAYSYKNVALDMKIKGTVSKEYKRKGLARKEEVGVLDNFMTEVALGENDSKRRGQHGKEG
jgi:hypothetical protein